MSIDKKKRIRVFYKTMFAPDVYSTFRGMSDAGKNRYLNRRWRTTFNSLPGEVVTTYIVPQLPLCDLLNVSEVNRELADITEETRSEFKKAHLLMKTEANNNDIEIMLGINPYTKSIDWHCFATIGNSDSKFFLPDFYDKLVEFIIKLQENLNLTDLVMNRLGNTIYTSISKKESIALSPDVFVLDENSLEGYVNAIYTFMEQMMIKRYHKFYVFSEGWYLHFKIATEKTIDDTQKQEAKYYPPTIYTEYEFNKNTITNEISKLLRLDLPTRLFTLE